MHGVRPFTAMIAALLVLAGCAPNADQPSTPTPVASRSGRVEPSATLTASPTAPGRTRPASPSATATPRPKKPHTISMEALIQKRYDGRDLRIGRTLAVTDAYRRSVVTYRGDGLRISGVINVPRGKGPFPVLVLNHGYIDRSRYFPGQGMPREEDYLARRGYVVLHTDYRGHAGSDPDPNIDYELRLGYAIDTINAVKAVKASTLSFLDGDRVGWLGRSMGGEVTLRALAAQPGLVDAAVIYASTSSLAADNWRKFYRDSPDRRRVNARIAKSYGLPDDNPAFWRAASARPYLDRVTEPVLVHHGTKDDTCPPAWSRATVAALEQAGTEVTLRTYKGAGHTFEGDQWLTSIRRTRAFFDHQLS